MPGGRRAFLQQRRRGGGSYGDPKAPTRLFRDDLSDTPTLYVLHPVTNRAAQPTWETYDADSDNAGKVFGRVGNGSWNATQVLTLSSAMLGAPCSGRPC